MHNTDLAQRLIHNLDALIHTVADDPSLVAGLFRERERLLDHLEGHLERHREGSLDHQLAAPPPLRVERLGSPRPRPTAARPATSARRAVASLRLEQTCYRALFFGLLDARRFDRMMLWGAKSRLT